MPPSGVSRASISRVAWDQSLHAMDYLVDADLQLGEDRKAKAVARAIVSMTRCGTVPCRPHNCSEIEAGIVASGLQAAPSTAQRNHVTDRTSPPASGGVLSYADRCEHSQLW